ncbi:MAG: hypothetical protein NTZ40_04655 [Cyanobacteria bacterium]|nr:hypothetical protein [Cyanobacteriota bacterium]
MNRRLSAALLTVSATVAMPLLSVAPASALTVTVGSIDYDVTVFNGSYNSNSALFQIPPAGQVPWWGNDMLAIDFAQQVYDQLGSGSTPGNSPVFAYEVSGTDILGISQDLGDILIQYPETIADNAAVKYAIATPLNSAPASVPAPLPVFGAAAALGWSRRIRKRITGSKV